MTEQEKKFKKLLELLASRSLEYCVDNGKTFYLPLPEREHELGVVLDLARAAGFDVAFRDEFKIVLRDLGFIDQGRLDTSGGFRIFKREENKLQTEDAPFDKPEFRGSNKK